MGGGGGTGGGGGISLEALQKLEAKAKEKLKESGDECRHVFISFAHEDLTDVNMLRGQAKNEKSALEFDDYSVHEPYDSKNADYIKSKIKERIEKSSVTIVYLTPDAARSKWVNWEVEESIRQGKGVIGVYKTDTAPAQLPAAFKANKCKAIKWAHQALTDAIEKACIDREPK